MLLSSWRRRCFHGINAMILMPQIFDVTANINERHIRNWIRMYYCIVFWWQTERFKCSLDPTKNPHLIWQRFLWRLIYMQWQVHVYSAPLPRNLSYRIWSNTQSSIKTELEWGCPNGTNTPAATNSNSSSFYPIFIRAYHWLTGNLFVKFVDRRCKGKAVMQHGPFSVIKALWP